MGADPINGLFADCIGDYHVPMVEPGQAEGLGAVKRGNVAYYDGHVELVADPMPGRVLLGSFIEQIFAQRGILFRLDDVLKLFG
jgi:prepilin-type processing-associated H-X9-DG protein